MKTAVCLKCKFKMPIRKYRPKSCPACGEVTHESMIQAVRQSPSLGVDGVGEAKAPSLVQRGLDRIKNLLT